MGTAFTRLVGCELPIQQAPIGFAAARPELPLAVAAAGGHGMLAGVRMPAADLVERLQALRAETRAFGVNLIEPLLEEDTLEAAAEHAPVIELYLGEPTAATVERASARGALVSWQVISGEEARAAEAAGCDMVVARGIEAGGRTKGGIGLLPLLDDVLDAVEVPVIAAGGIATARAVAAVLAAGAAAARVGTRFLAAEEVRRIRCTWRPCWPRAGTTPCSPTRSRRRPRPGRPTGCCGARSRPPRPSRTTWRAR